MGVLAARHPLLFSGEGRGPGFHAQRLRPWAPAFAGEQGGVAEVQMRKVPVR